MSGSGTVGENAAAQTASTGHTHLFPGARLMLGAGEVRPGTLSLRFSDGGEVDARLISLDGVHSWVLAMPEFTTVAGATIAAKVWSVREFTKADDGQGLVIGALTALQDVPDGA